MGKEVEKVMEGYKETEIGVLPEDWEVVKLENCLSLIRNGISKKQNATSKTGYPVTRIETISEDRINPDKIGYIDNLTPAEVEKFRLRLGDILFSHINSEPQIGRSVVYEGWPDTLLHGMNLLLLRTNSNTIPRWLNYLFMHYRATEVFIKIAARAVNQSSINQSKMKSLLIPLPPLSEQRAIAHVLSTIHRAIEATERVIATTRELKKSLMHYLFTYGPVPVDQIDRVLLKDTEIGPVPEHWEVVRLGEVFEFSRKPRSLDINKCNQIPFITMEYIPDEEVYLSKYDLKVSDEIKSGTFFFNGDLLIAKITPSFENGKQCIVKNLPTDFGYATTEVWPIHGTDEAKILCLFYYLKKHDIRAEIASKMEGSTGRQRVPKNVLENLMIPNPPLSEQREIARILQSVDRKIESEEKRKETLKALFKTMLHLLMTGKLRVKNLEVAFR